MGVFAAMWLAFISKVFVSLNVKDFVASVPVGFIESRSGGLRRGAFQDARVKSNDLTSRDTKPTISGHKLWSTDLYYYELYFNSEDCESFGKRNTS